MRFVGEPVAVVVADSRAHAVDAAESVLVEYDLAPRGRRPRPRARAGRSRAVPGAREQRGSRVHGGHRPRRAGGRGSRDPGTVRQPAVGADPHGDERRARHPRPGHGRAHGVAARAVALRLAEDGRACPRPRGVEGSRHRAEGRRWVRREDPDLRGAGGGLCARAPARRDRSGTWRPGRRACRS